MLHVGISSLAHLFNLYHRPDSSTAASFPGDRASWSIERIGGLTRRPSNLPHYKGTRSGAYKAPDNKRQTFQAIPPECVMTRRG
jgi:hypothetical protein